MVRIDSKRQKRERRHRRVRAKVRGTADRPRLSVFRSNLGLYIQLIDDGSARTLASAAVQEIKKGRKKQLTKKEIAKALGELIAKKAREKNIERAVFDRGGYAYHGLIKEVAQGARMGGLKF